MTYTYIGPWTQHIHKCLAHLNYGRDEDPAKSTYSIMAFVKRGLSTKRAHAKSTMSKHVCKGIERGPRGQARTHACAQRSDARSAAGSKEQTSCGGHGRRAHHAAQRVTKKMKR